MDHFRKRRLIFSIGVILIAVLAIGTIIDKSRGIDVLFINDGNAPIKDVHLIFTGGMQKMSELAAKEKHKVKINPSGESNLQVSFVDSAGRYHKELVDVYFEKNYRGKIIIRIDSKGKLEWKSDIHI